MAVRRGAKRLGGERRLEPDTPRLSMEARVIVVEACTYHHGWHVGHCHVVIHVYPHGGKTNYPKPLGVI